MSFIGGKIDVHTFRSPNEQIERLIPGRLSYASVKFSGALPLLDNGPIDWFENMRNGIVDRRAARIALLDNDMQTELQQINLFELFPIGLEIDIPGSRWFLTVAVQRVDFNAN